MRKTLKKLAASLTMAFALVAGVQSADAQTRVDVSANGHSVKVELANDGSLTVFTNGNVAVKPAPANDISALTLVAGAKVADGSVFAGLSIDGKQQIYTTTADMNVTMTFNDCAKATRELDSGYKHLGHADWQVPDLATLKVLQKNQNEGALKGTFKTADASGSDCPDWYWSSTEHRANSSTVHGVRFSDGYEGWDLEDNLRLSCRPVRLVAVTAGS